MVGAVAAVVVAAERGVAVADPRRPRQGREGILRLDIPGMGAQLGGAVVVAFDRVFRIQPEILEAVAEAAEQRAAGAGGKDVHAVAFRSEEHTSELPSIM